MIWPFGKLGRGFAPSAMPGGGVLPYELVAAIEDVDIVWRSQHEADGVVYPRPLATVFFDRRFIYLDDRAKVTGILLDNFPDLNEKQVARAINLLHREIKRRDGGEPIGEKEYARMAGRYGHLKRRRHAGMIDQYEGGMFDDDNG